MHHLHADMRSAPIGKGKDMYDTADALPPLPYYPDTRRLIGLETFAYDQAYATEPPCAGCTISPPKNAVLSFRSNVYPTTIVSPLNNGSRRCPRCCTRFAATKNVDQRNTSRVQRTLARCVHHARDAFVRQRTEHPFGQFDPQRHSHRVTQHTIAERSNGNRSVAGLATAFSLQKEFSDLAFVSRSIDATTRLQEYLVQREITVMPLFEPTDDPLLIQAMQQRVVDQKNSLHSIWTNDRLSFVSNETDDDELSLSSWPSLAINRWSTFETHL
jgi:hypothetical protein